MKFNFKYLDLKFVESAAEFDQCLQHDMQEIAFVGASNAGKSSAINAISNQKRLAKTSKTPGKTKLFNFFKAKLGYIVDFPGYGYSKVSKSQKKDWAIQLPQYFLLRNNLVGVILFTDIRNPMRELDLTMYEMLANYGLPTLIVLTKTDKVSKEELEATIKKISVEFGVCLSFSIKENSSIERLIKEINELLSS
jgi:GTP-binding protein